MFFEIGNAEKAFVKLIKAFVVIVCVFGAIGGFGLYMDYIEIAETGREYVSVFLTDLFAKAAAAAAVFAATLTLSLINGAVLRKIAYAKGELMWIMKRKFLFAVSAIFATATAAACSSGLGKKYLLFKNAVMYRETDPLFNKDISYYFFQRDFYMALVDIAALVLVLVLIYTVFAYIVMYAADANRESFIKLVRDKAIFTHCGIIVFLFGVVKALSYHFTAEGLVYSKTADVTGAGYTAVKIWVPFYKAAPVIIALLIVYALVALFRGKIKHVIGAAVAFPILTVLVYLIAFITQSFIVEPKEVAYEKPYIESNMKFTKMGFKLDNVEVRTFPVEDTLTAEDIANNDETVSNIRITDLVATQSVSNSTKSVRDYYTFGDSDIVVYDVNGKKTAINISARELDSDKLPDVAQNYINRHLRYTHGYGIVANLINRVNSDGQPVYVIDNMPVTSEAGFPEITQPRIYYGEKSDDYVVVNTEYDELDYVTDDEQTGKIFDSESGIKMTPFNRLLFAVNNLDYKLLISGYINSESRLLLNRNIFDRVQKAVPFLEQDSDPYILIDENGALKWIIDLYTTSDKMPYGEKYNGVSYIRNSAKAVVDAYSGDVKVYITDDSDAMIKTYEKIYPSAFAGHSLPEDLSEHIRYPEELFRIQYEVYLRYHMTDTANFYGNSDLWMTPKEKYMNNETTDIQPYYNLMSLSRFGSEGSELVIMQPYAPANKENLVGWLTAESNGNMLLYKFPTNKTVYGTLHIENRVDSNDEISKEISLWDQGGSSVIKGNLLVIPIENSLLYIEPIYLTTANSAALPEVKRVIVAYGEEVVMEQTLEKALHKLFGSGDAGDIDEADVENEALSLAPSQDNSDIVRAFENVREAMKKGDWSLYGAAMDELEQAIYSKYDSEAAE